MTRHTDLALTVMTVAGALATVPAMTSTTATSYEVRLSRSASAVASPRVLIGRIMSNTNSTVGNEAQMRDLTDGDFVVLTHEDIAMLEFAAGVDSVDVDYSTFFVDDE